MFKISRQTKVALNCPHFIKNIKQMSWPLFFREVSASLRQNLGCALSLKGPCWCGKPSGGDVAKHPPSHCQHNGHVGKRQRSTKLCWFVATGSFPAVFLCQCNVNVPKQLWWDSVYLPLGATLTGSGPIFWCLTTFFWKIFFDLQKFFDQSLNGFFLNNSVFILE